MEEEKLLKCCYDLALFWRIQGKTRFYPEDLAAKFKFHYRYDLPFLSHGCQKIEEFLKKSELFLPVSDEPEDTRLRCLLQEDYDLKLRVPPDPNVIPAIVNLEPNETTENVILRIKTEPKEYEESVTAQGFRILKVKQEPEEEIVPPASPDPVEQLFYGEEMEVEREEIVEEREENEKEDASSVFPTAFSSLSMETEITQSGPPISSSSSSSLPPPPQEKTSATSSISDVSSPPAAQSTTDDPSRKTSYEENKMDETAVEAPRGPVRFPSSASCRPSTSSENSQKTNETNQKTHPKKFPDVIQKLYRCLQHIAKKGKEVDLNAINDFFRSHSRNSNFCHEFRSAFPNYNFSKVEDLSEGFISTDLSAKGVWKFFLNNPTSRISRQSDKESPKKKNSQPNGSAPFYDPLEAKDLIKKIKTCLEHLGQSKEYELQEISKTFNQLHKRNFVEVCRIVFGQSKWTLILQTAAAGTIDVTLKNSVWTFKLPEASGSRCAPSAQSSSAPSTAFIPPPPPVPQPLIPEAPQTYFPPQYGYSIPYVHQMNAYASGIPAYPMYSQMNLPMPGLVINPTLSVNPKESHRSPLIPSPSGIIPSQRRSSENTKKSPLTRTSSSASNKSQSDEIPLDPAPAASSSRRNSQDLQKMLFVDKLVECLKESENFQLDEDEMRTKYTDKFPQSGFYGDLQMEFGSTSLRKIKSSVDEKIDLYFHNQRWIFRLRSKMRSPSNNEKETRNERRRSKSRSSSRERIYKRRDLSRNSSISPVRQRRRFN